MARVAVSGVEGKRILVTGAARGVGEEIARQAIDAGARVALADVRDEPGRAVAQSLGDCAAYVHLDVSREADWIDALPQITDHLGGLDGLVNNAAILHMGAIDEIPLDEAHRLLDVNLFGVFLGMRVCTPLLRAAGGGSIVNIGSIDGTHGMNSIAVYSASKWGVRGLSKSAAIELGRFAIRVNTINPSLGSPDMFAPFSPRFDWERYQRTAPPPKLYKDDVPYDVTTSDTAKMTLFLLSDDSRGCTGADFAVDAGFTAGLYCAGLPGF
jgi:3alpha(or 20beta)-hydroxysteroid dehydrogenase